MTSKQFYYSELYSCSIKHTHTHKEGGEENIFELTHIDKNLNEFCLATKSCLIGILNMSNF